MNSTHQRPQPPHSAANAGDPCGASGDVQVARTIKLIVEINNEEVLGVWTDSGEPIDVQVVDRDQYYLRELTGSALRDHKAEIAALDKAIKTKRLRALY